MLTVLSVVLMFALFILFYYPASQQKLLRKNYDSEVTNYCNSNALIIQVAISEEKWGIVRKSLESVLADGRLQFVCLIKQDSIWNSDRSSFTIDKSVFQTYPDTLQVDPYAISNDDFIIKNSPISSGIVDEIMMSFSTREIEEGSREIRIASIIASLTVFIIGLLIGYLLARRISIPVLALRDAANRVGEGDLTQSVTNSSRDEIGELGVAFNKMVKDLDTARREINQRTQELTKEKRKSDELLLNILPSETAEELKSTGQALAKHYDSVTVLFTDFKDFTAISEQMTANQIVTELHHCFSAFDNIIKKHKIEKIKTIGDAYMCVAGLPVKNTTHPFDAINAAMEIREWMLNYKKEKEAIGEITFEVRIGMHTGPVVAGIVGVNKFAYDIWGSTVNTASRLETAGEPNKINISSFLYNIIKDEFDCTLRGEISVKGLGKIPMYFLNGKKEVVQ